MVFEPNHNHPADIGYPGLTEDAIEQAISHLSQATKLSIEQPHLTLHTTRTELGRKAFKLVDDAWDELPFRVRIDDKVGDIYLTEGEIFAGDTIDGEPYIGDAAIRGVEAIERYVAVRRQSDRVLNRKVLETFGLAEPLLSEELVARRVIGSGIRERNRRLMRE